MFPTPLEPSYHPNRSRRRGRNEMSNRDYICPCGKSYLSYPALFTHIKIKHNGRAPGQVIKPRSENANRRGRPKAKEIYDSESDTEDFALNSINRLCDFISDVQKGEDNNLFKQIYTNSEFYLSYVNFNPQEQEPKYDEAEELYQENCINVFCECLTEINKKISEPYHFDVLFVFFVMLTRSINADGDSSKRNATTESIKCIVGLINKFFNQDFVLYKAQYKLNHVIMFSDQSMAKLIQHFFHWLTTKKYIGYKLKVKEEFFNSNKINALEDP